MLDVPSCCTANSGKVHQLVDDS